MSGEVELITGTYYVTQTLEDCESQPVEVYVIIYDNSSPPVADPDQAFCAGGTIGDLIATGEDIHWYDVQEGGIPLDENTVLTTGNYYASQLYNGMCEGPRTEVHVTVFEIPSAPEAEPFQLACRVSDLIAEGENIQWFTEEEGGITLSLETPVSGGTYYVSQTVNICESPRTAVIVENAVLMPVAPSPQNFEFSGIHVSELVAEGENINWFSSEYGGEPLIYITTSGNYYVSQKIGDCESPRAMVTITFAHTVHYVKPVPSGNGDGSSWGNASDDLQAMINASSNNHYIFVAAGTYKPIRRADALETITLNNRNNAFVLKNGVKIYGGFAGTEISLHQRDLSNPDNKSILSGDFNDNDVISGSGNSLNISGNAENAFHVVISASDNSSISSSTVLDGFTITGGNANSYTNTITVNNRSIDRGQGGGLNNSGASTPTIVNCTFTGNYAGQGAGVYSNNSLTTNIRFINSLIVRNRGEAYGGGLYLYGRTQLINSTVWGNRAGSSSGAIRNLSGTLTIQNSIIFGNSTGIVNEGSVVRNYSLVQDNNDTANGNIPGNVNPQFMNTSSNDFRLQITSPVINKGNISYIPSEITTDIAGNDRVLLGGVDLGAYESSRHGVIWTTANAWLNNIEPDEEKEVYVEGDLEVGLNYDSFDAKSLKIEQGGSLIIQQGNYVKVHGQIINANTDDPQTPNIDEQALSFIVRNGGNLIQTQDYITDDNTGSITVERESQPIVRLDYTLWSSPVKGQQLQAFSPLTLPNRIYTYETTSANQHTDGAYEVVNDTSADFTQGKGYLFRAPNDWISENSETGIPYSGKFIGEPSNGDISVDVYPDGYTSVGNPYPSNIDPEAFLAANPGLGNLYFWNNPQRIFNEETETWGYIGTRYLTYSSLGFNDPAHEGNAISVGQGFIVYTTGNSVQFDNSMRVATQESFFKIDDMERHRFWLKLSGKNAQEFNQILIGYMTGATNGIDHKIEGEQFGYNGSAIYNLIDDGRFAIQGRKLPFETSDVVSLGFYAESAGKYKISITSYDGLFAEGNTSILLKDNFLNKFHNLLESDYEFESVEGEFNERFEIWYEKKTILNTNEFDSGSIQIYQHDNYIHIRSDLEKISSIDLYDLHGRRIYTKENINSHYYQIPSERFGSGVLIVKVRIQNGKTETKKY